MKSGNLKNVYRMEPPSSGCPFTCLFHKFEKPLFVFALKITKSPQIASDIVQDVFMKLWEQRNQLSRIDDMEKWLHRSVKNRIIDVLRKTAADERLREQLWNNVTSNNLNTESVVEAREYRILMEQAVNALPEKRREVYRLRREDGLNYQEISEKLSISQHTVKNQMTGALRFIQRFVSGSLGLLLILLMR